MKKQLILILMYFILQWSRSASSASAVCLAFASSCLRTVSMASLLMLLFGLSFGVSSANAEDISSPIIYVGGNLGVNILV